MPQNKLKRGSTFGSEGRYPGLPGYRTREGRSGLDPIETNLESAYMEGTFYRRLFTLKVRTRNVFHLILMFVFGVAPFISTIYLVGIGFYESSQNTSSSILIAITWIGAFLLIPGMITLNFLLSIMEIMRIIPPIYAKSVKKKEIKKKFPKRRKDFK